MNKQLLQLFLILLAVVLIWAIVNSVTTSKENRLNLFVVVQGPINSYIEARMTIGKIESENTTIGDNNSILKREKDV